MGQAIAEITMSGSSGNIEASTGKEPSPLPLDRELKSGEKPTFKDWLLFISEGRAPDTKTIKHWRENPEVYAQVRSENFNLFHDGEWNWKAARNYGAVLGIFALGAISCGLLTPTGKDSNPDGGDSTPSDTGEDDSPDNNPFCAAVLGVAAEIEDGMLTDFAVVSADALDNALNGGDQADLQAQIGCFIPGAEVTDIDQVPVGDGSMGLISVTRPRATTDIKNRFDDYLVVPGEIIKDGVMEYTSLTVLNLEGASLKAEGDGFVAEVPEVAFNLVTNKEEIVGSSLLTVNKVGDNGNLQFSLAINGQELVLSPEQISEISGFNELAVEAAEQFEILSSEKITGVDGSAFFKAAGVETGSDGGVPVKLSPELHVKLLENKFAPITAIVGGMTDVISRIGENGRCEVMLTPDIYPEGSDLNPHLSTNGIAIYSTDGTGDQPGATGEFQVIKEIPVPVGKICLAAIATEGNPEYRAGTTVIFIAEQGKAGASLDSHARVVYEAGLKIQITEGKDGISWVVMDGGTVVDEQSLDFGAQLTAEMQEMGLQLEEDEDGRTIAVDDRGYMKFYENEAGVWVDWYEELIDGAVEDFWFARGEWSIVPELQETNIYPVWTGEIEVFSLTMDGMGVEVQGLVCVITDPIDPNITREILVPVEYGLPDGQKTESPLMWGWEISVDSMEDVLSKLSPGDQFDVRMFTRVLDRNSVCKITHACGPPIIVNQFQELTVLFTAINEGDSSGWPERLIVPVFSIYFTDE